MMTLVVQVDLVIGTGLEAEPLHETVVVALLLTQDRGLLHLLPDARDTLPPQALPDHQLEGDVAPQAILGPGRLPEEDVVLRAILGRLHLVEGVLLATTQDRRLQRDAGPWLLLLQEGRIEVTERGIGVLRHPQREPMEGMRLLIGGELNWIEGKSWSGLLL